MLHKKPNKINVAKQWLKCGIKSFGVFDCQSKGFSSYRTLGTWAHSRVL